MLTLARSTRGICGHISYHASRVWSQLHVKPDDSVFECPDECHGRVEGFGVNQTSTQSFLAADCTRIRTLGQFYNAVVFMAAQPSKDGRLGGSPQNSYAGRLPSKRFVQGIAAFHQCSILPEVGELMVNTQQYDSHEGRFDTSFARVFHS